MSKSQQTFKKKELAKQKQQQRVEKWEKMQERKAQAQKGRSLDDMIAYVDENGNLSATPPDPKMKKIFAAEDIQIRVPKLEERPVEDKQRTGTVTFFNAAKGFGFIKDSKNGESAFVHANQLKSLLKENDKVTYEVENGFKGLNAVNVKIAG